MADIPSSVRHVLTGMQSSCLALPPVTKAASSLACFCWCFFAQEKKKHCTLFYELAFVNQMLCHHTMMVILSRFWSAVEFAILLEANLIWRVFNMFLCNFKRPHHGC